MIADTVAYFSADERAGCRRWDSRSLWPGQNIGFSYVQELAGHIADCPDDDITGFFARSGYAMPELEFVCASSLAHRGVIALVEFDYSEKLVELRRSSAPSAKFDNGTKLWFMLPDEADAFEATVNAYAAANGKYYEVSRNHIMKAFRAAAVA
jgi:hypothetical protein